MSISVLGAGSWGTAVANLLSGNGNDVTMVARTESQATEITNSRENTPYLPGVILDGGLKIVSGGQAAVADSQIIVLAVPSRWIRESLTGLTDELKHCVSSGGAIVSLVKGLEPESHSRVTQIVSETLDVSTDVVSVLTGPNHAEEVAKGIPTAAVIAAPKLNVAERLQSVFNTDSFRVYTHPDPLGAELAGASKNVIAIAAGISDGLGYGDNTKAALLTRGLNEMARLGAAAGAQGSTYYGLAGMGDLIATGTSAHSRNRRVGESLGRGETIDYITSHMRMVAEGVTTAPALLAMAQEYGVELPITQQVVNVITGACSPRASVDALMTRELASEV